MIPYSIFVIIIALFMGFILYNLFRALYFLVTQKEKGRGTARHLGRRIGLSMFFFVLVLTLKVLGLVEARTLDDVIRDWRSDRAQQQSDSETEEGKTLEEIQQMDNPDGGRIRLKP